MFIVTMRISCAGCSVAPNARTMKQLKKLLKEFGGKPGQSSDKSEDLEFAKEWQAKRFQAEGEKLFVIFD